MVDDIYANYIGNQMLFTEIKPCLFAWGDWRKSHVRTYEVSPTIIAKVQEDELMPMIITKLREEEVDKAHNLF
jgi:hypothetical protein